MRTSSRTETERSASAFDFNFAKDAWAYWVDACQRSILFLDTLQQRTDLYRQHQAKSAPHVLKFDCELVMDGRELSRPVNYVLAKIVPPDNVRVDDSRRPFIVVDPRAGHGPGIGGFKPQSEIGVALKAGHPCYFIGFLPEPEPNQTIEDVIAAMAVFLQHVGETHADAEGKPAVVGNCQAGWAVLLLASLRPDLFGPIIVAGTPLAYWAGALGENPIRYKGGLLGGSWLTALAGDLGNGKFDGAYLVENFEGLDPANTYWRKQHTLYSNIDTEAPRYLDFEQWWGAHVLLNAEEMQFIADKLFIGNQLAAAQITTADGSHCDLRNIKSPIIVFCSKADNITPPSQALGWILELYDSAEDIRAHGQTIVYAVHESVGHLGIFVSGSVSKKEHDEFASNIDLIDVLPPGLYEAVMTPKEQRSRHSDLVGGDYLVRFEARTLDDLRTVVHSDSDDDRKFATVARISEINLGFYRTFVQPALRPWTSEWAAEWTRRLHPLRVQYDLFSRDNPMLRVPSSVIEEIRENRQPVAKSNVFWQMQEAFSHSIETSLDFYRSQRDQLSEALFHAIYGQPFLQALVGLRASDQAPRRPGSNPAHQAFVIRRSEELRSALMQGGPLEATIRALLYVRMPDRIVDERGFNFLRRMRKATGDGLTLQDFKKIVREQFLMLVLDERRAVAALPAMLAKDPELAAELGGKLDNVLSVVGVMSDDSKRRLVEIERIFANVDDQAKFADEPHKPEHRQRANVAGPRTQKHH